MTDNKRDFVRFLIDAGALKFGEFTLKSGRKSPYFINMATFNNGELISQLGCFYASELLLKEVNPQLLVGAAYKGIPLCIIAASALYAGQGVIVDWVFDRKEVKTHGDAGGIWCGCTPTQRDGIVIVDDVITAGTAIGEIMDKLKASGVTEVDSILLAVDRQEIGKDGNLSAIEEVKELYGVKVHTIINYNDILEVIESGGADEGLPYLGALYAYRKKYGAVI